MDTEKDPYEFEVLELIAIFFCVFVVCFAIIQAFNIIFN